MLDVLIQILNLILSIRTDVRIRASRLLDDPEWVFY